MQGWTYARLSLHMTYIFVKERSEFIGGYQWQNISPWKIYFYFGTPRI